MTDDRLAPGDPAPDFSLPDADGNQVSLSALRGKKVIIYFYPASDRSLRWSRKSQASLGHPGVIAAG